MKKKHPSISFFFSSIKYFETLIFRSVLLFEEKEPLIPVLYFLVLKDKCQKEINRLTMKNDEKKIFKYLDDIENSRGN